MLLKWITCAVPPQTREAFSEAQAKWAPLRTAPGFHGQLGGWSHPDPTHAHLLAFWQDQAHYDYFMRHLHDPLYEQTGQAGTYSGIAVTHLAAKIDPALLPTLLAQTWLLVTEPDQPSVRASSPVLTLTGTGSTPLRFAWATERPDPAETPSTRSTLVRLKQEWLIPGQG
ncbi:YdbC family protein [Laceyella putida]|uniref:YdbC family protein n=1 Tax=Laceyella putida TaxID=110101 RepID=A0ABW2RJV3_9BACL